MAEKKKTPLQEAIEQTKQQVSKLIEASERFYVNTDVAQQQLRVVITNLELLLPKEKEFAKEMWNDAIDHFSDSPDSDKKLVQFFNDCYQQYEP